MKPLLSRREIGDAVFVLQRMVALRESLMTSRIPAGIPPAPMPHETSPMPWDLWLAVAKECLPGDLRPRVGSEQLSARMLAMMAQPPLLELKPHNQQWLADSLYMPVVSLVGVSEAKAPTHGGIARMSRQPTMLTLLCHWAIAWWSAYAQRTMDMPSMLTFLWRVAGRGLHDRWTINAVWETRRALFRAFAMRNPGT